MPYDPTSSRWPVGTCPRRPRRTPGLTRSLPPTTHKMHVGRPRAAELSPVAVDADPVCGVLEQCFADLLASTADRSDVEPLVPDAEAIAPSATADAHLAVLRPSNDLDERSDPSGIAPQSTRSYPRTHSLADEKTVVEACMLETCRQAVKSIRRSGAP